MALESLQELPRHLRVQSCLVSLSRYLNKSEPIPSGLPSHWTLFNPAEILADSSQPAFNLALKIKVYKVSLAKCLLFGWIVSSEKKMHI